MVGPFPSHAGFRNLRWPPGDRFAGQAVILPVALLRFVFLSDEAVGVDPCLLLGCTARGCSLRAGPTKAGFRHVPFPHCIYVEIHGTLMDSGSYLPFCLGLPQLMAKGTMASLRFAAAPCAFTRGAGSQQTPEHLPICTGPG